MPNVHVRTDAPLHAQLVDLARSEGLSLNAYLVRLVRADVGRRQRLASAVGRDWRATDAELADALGAVVSAPLSDVEQAHLPADPGAAVSYAVARAANKRRTARASRPAPSASSKPAPRPSAAPKQRSAKPSLHLISAEEYDQLLALRARRAGKPAPPKGASQGRSVTVSASDLAELKRGIQ